MLKTDYITDFSSFYEKVGDLFEEHYKGCEEYRASSKNLSINVELFQKLLDAGLMNIFVLKDEEELIGYVNVSINPSPLFDKPQAVIDFLYILPEHRRSNYASLAITEIEKELASEGVTDISIMLPDKDYSESVADSLGYVKTSTIYTKCLGDS